jgi:hypothetical protein
MPLTRSEIMKRVRQRDTAPEVALRKSLFKIGPQYRIGKRIGTVWADIVFSPTQLAAFVGGNVSYRNESISRDLWARYGFGVFTSPDRLPPCSTLTSPSYAMPPFASP